MKSRNSREGLYAGFRVTTLDVKHVRTGPHVFPGVEALRYRHTESEQVFDICSHIQDCPACKGKGYIPGVSGTQWCAAPNCEEGKVWV